MLRSLSLLAMMILPTIALSQTRVAAPPAAFGNDWDDPRTAAPPVERPATKSCTVTLVDHGFVSFDPYRSTVTPPPQCAGPWSKVVLDLHGTVKGRQYDRIGHLEIGGVTVLRTSTPEPSREGIEWHVEKDISAYAPLFAGPQPVAMTLGNVVNDTYTGVFQVKVTATFYAADAAHPAISAADRIMLPRDLRHDGPDITGQIQIPANARRLTAEVYATGSGGGCEEFWYFTTPKEAKYSCPSPQGPYREVQVLLDGRVAGIAMPYPHIYTGGWSNPFLWYVLPAPRTFDIPSIQYDLTPFIGVLNDGRPHELRVRVLGVAADSEGWTLLPSLHVWLDEGSKATRGRLLEHALEDLRLASPVSAGREGETTVNTEGAHRLRVRGELHTSRGREEIAIDYQVANRNLHRWDREETRDDLEIEWTQRVSTRVKRPRQRDESTAVTRRYAIAGGIHTVPAPGIAAAKDAKEPPQRLTTRIRIDDETTVREQHGKTQATREARDRFEGSASYTQGVPREQRNAVGRSQQRYQRRDGAGACYDRSIAQENGTIVEELSGCR